VNTTAVEPSDASGYHPIVITAGPAGTRVSARAADSFPPETVTARSAAQDPAWEYETASIESSAVDSSCSFP